MTYDDIDLLLYTIIHLLKMPNLNGFDSIILKEIKKSLNIIQC